MQIVNYNMSDVLKRYLTLQTHHIHSLPILILMPHSSCNCRCVMCDIWKANRDRRQLTTADLQPHLKGFKKLNVRQIVFSGGEALLHKNLWALCELLKKDLPQLKIILLSTGLLLKKHAAEVIRYCNEVIVSLDGSPEIHNRIRNIPQAYDKLAAGVTALHSLQSDYRVSARCVVQQQNFHDLENIITAAKQLGLQQLSLLAADISSAAFNRDQPWNERQRSQVALSADEAIRLEHRIESIINQYDSDFRSGFIAENPDKLRRIAYYYQALHGIRAFPSVHCNAPWVSAVVESTGAIQPCFFHRQTGSIKQADFASSLNSKTAMNFRKNLDVASNPICKKCVCSLNLKPFTRI